jgi:hypothetical protein
VLGGLYPWLLRRRETACRGCPHDCDSHKPYSPGGRPGYCTSCGCYQYRPERAWTLALAFLRERPPPVTPDVLHQHPVPFPVRDRPVREDRTLLDIPRARPFTAGQAGPRVPRQREAGPR